jgi:hypothetical protein
MNASRQRARTRRSELWFSVSPPSGNSGDSRGATLEFLEASDRQRPQRGRIAGDAPLIRMGGAWHALIECPEQFAQAFDQTLPLGRSIRHSIHRSHAAAATTATPAAIRKRRRTARSCLTPLASHTSQRAAARSRSRVSRATRTPNSANRLRAGAGSTGEVAL